MLNEFPFVSIVIPTLGRPEKLDRCIKSIFDNSGYPDDRFEVVPEYDNFEDRQGAPKTLKKGVARAKGELIMFLGNDTVPQQNFLIEAVNRMIEVFPEQDGLIGLNDEYFEGDQAAHWLASKKLLPFLGGEFFHTGYHHVCCDNELIERCKTIKKYAWAEKSKLFHDHPILGGPPDDVYIMAYNTMREAEDHELYKKRGEELGFAYRKCELQDKNVPRYINLGLRMRNLGTFYPERAGVLNVGLGSGNGELAQQLINAEFKQLDNIDVEPIYIMNAKTWNWKTKLVLFMLKDIRECDFNSYDLCLFLDIIEHLPKNDGIKIVDSVKRAIFFVPLENSFRPNQTGIPSETHQSIWTEEDFKSRGFTTEVLKNFHGDFDAMWAIKY
jgi:glycosyltransferase involved in cell wall biosynthesis